PSAQSRAISPGLCQIVAKRVRRKGRSVLRFFEQRLGLGEVLDGVEAEQLEEALGRAVKDWPAGLFGAAGDLDQVLFHQAADRFPAGDAADGFDVGAEDR